MAIRLRQVDNHLVALCAAQTVSLDGDVYLDDAAHEALALKFARENPSLGFHTQGDIVLAESQKDSRACAERDAWLASLENAVP